MQHKRSPRFGKELKALEPELEAQVRTVFRSFDENMSHLSLHIERIEGYPGVLSGRISRNYRCTFLFEEDPETSKRICVYRVISADADVHRKR